MALRYRVIIAFVAASAAAACAWTTPVNLGATVNSASLDASSTLGDNQSTTYIFFSSNRTGGQGLSDIWYASGTAPNFGAPVNMGASINSTVYDGGPCICWTGGPTANTLYFYSTRAGGAGGSDIYETTYSGSAWSTPVSVGSNINTAASEYYAHVASWQGQTRMYFVRENAIYYSTYAGGQWGTPNYIYLGGGDAYHPCQRGEGEGAKLYFSSTRGGGYGDYDIWVSTYSGGDWGTPVNLGPDINTADVENCPAFAPDGVTMYFSSTRPGGQGYYDIWYTVLDNPAVEPASVGGVKAAYR
ncbi:MAG: hypothetical protein PVH29_11860 [Candidatus Zixiibacteriota bacterium]